MADGIIVVDAQPPYAADKVCAYKSTLRARLKLVVVINKTDKPARRIEEVEDELVDLFLSAMTVTSITRFIMQLVKKRKFGKQYLKTLLNTLI